ncbi:hypothetical protein OE749_08945 [Aestuariibacter sp. AA17]|uniref:RND efflux pump membrane fusion protein barrel-sandwich domain-containing protein n=1 Tax=Fluctibacter corallii TaxID=2984329 RepID=A0ABT3A925_9ALTE|nr:HlyD family efflux transporter periplasmic adaptor subunit [Aestuariibacter sp. AA17]MCV2884821.1 hypothetical protein [Aestuariibacter sp. AA17]
MLSKTVIVWLALFSFAVLADTSVVVQSPWTASYEKQYRTVATVKSRYVIQYAAQVEGKVSEIYALGDVVTIGDALVRQSDPLQQLELERAESLVSSLTASLDISELEVEHLDALVRSNSVSTQQAKILRLTLDKARADLAVQQNQAKQLRQSLTFLTTQAVKPGTVIEQHVNIGEFVEKGDALLTTVDMSAVQYWLTLPLELAGLVDENTRIETLTGDMSLPIASVIPTGKTSVSILSTLVDMTDRAVGHLATQEVVVTMYNEQPLQWFHRDGVIDRNGITQVRVVDSQARAAYRTIDIAAEKGQFVGVAGQLHSGDKIILRGMMDIKPESGLRIDSDRTVELKKQFVSNSFSAVEGQAW